MISAMRILLIFMHHHLRNWQDAIVNAEVLFRVRHIDLLGIHLLEGIFVIGTAFDQ